jgi:hypothetical protein
MKRCDNYRMDILYERQVLFLKKPLHLQKDRETCYEQGKPMSRQ